MSKGTPACGHRCTTTNDAASKRKQTLPMDILGASKYSFQKGNDKLYMRAQCIPVCTCTEKTHSSAGLCWFTLVHIGSHGPQCNQWRLHLHQLWPFPYFPFKLSNSLMPPAFHRKFSSRDMIRTSKLHICGHCLHCIKDATIYWNHVLFWLFLF